MNGALFDRHLVISAAESLAAPEGASVPLKQGSPLARRMDEMIQGLTGAVPSLAPLDGGSSSHEWPEAHRESSRWLCSLTKRALESASLVPGKRRSNRVSAANHLAYMYFSSEEKANPFSFKQNLEHQTPSFLGDAFRILGPQFTLREGDNGDLVGLEAALRCLQLQDSILVSGVSAPHHLMLRMEIAAELNALKAAGYGVDPHVSTAHREAAAVLVLERRSTVEARGVKPLARIVGTYHCMRPLDYRRPERIEAHLRGCMRKLKGISDRPVGRVYGCFRRNGLVSSMEEKLLEEVFPGAEPAKPDSVRSEPIEGFLEIQRACEALCSGPLQGTDVVVQSLSRNGHYAGVVLRGVEA